MRRYECVAIVCLLLVSTRAAAATITNDEFWTDTSGNLVCSQGGGILKIGGMYYWYGVNYAAAATYAAKPGSANAGRAVFRSVTCYSSTDLSHWKFVGDVLTRDQVGRGWFGRIGVAYNHSSHQYVLIGQGSSPQRRHGEYFATSSSPTGPFRFNNVQATLPFIVTGATGDQTVFQDDDGMAYVICCNSHGRSHLYVAPLRSSDFLAVESATEIFKGPGREGNCMFKHDGRYYFCSSNLHGWNASPTYVISATSILGPYGPESVMRNSQLDFSHVTQCGFFFTVDGTAQSTVIYAGDRWCDFGGNGIGYNQWVPLSFDGATPVFNSLSQWNIDATTGQWRVGPRNNYVLNPSFEADRVRQHFLAGWTAASDIAGGSPNGNSSKGEAHTGNFCLRQAYPTAYKAEMSQDIANLPDGDYTLSAWVKSSGGQNSAVLAIRDFGGGERSQSLAEPIDQWTLVTIPSIRLSSGKCRIAIRSDASAGNWLEVDDVSLVRFARR
ncbi:MAG TPA: family 43 glycosylhydrolase [Tepidisphaeraceae bacterium]|nr:family 43 glycosylhydrolase [Tepidisphaeraceae bacterium]